VGTENVVGGRKSGVQVWSNVGEGGAGVGSRFCKFVTKSAFVSLTSPVAVSLKTRKVIQARW